MYNYVDWNIRKKPYPFLMKAVNEFKNINGQVIVEVGSMRVPADHDINDYSHECCMEGHSSIILASNCKEFHSVDIDQKVARTTFKALKSLAPACSWNVYCGDGIKFLNEFKGKIDLLFLDAWDIGTPNYAENHLLAFKAAESKLNDKHVVLIDDTDINWTEEKGLHNDEESMGGKGAAVVPYLLSKNYEVVFKGRQTCLIKRK